MYSTLFTGLQCVLASWFTKLFTYMTKWSIVVCGVCYFSFASVYAQEKKHGRLPDTECAFSQYASTHTTKQAFLYFLDSSGIVFNKGLPYNGLAVWRQQPENNFKLRWHPAYYVVSADESLGFTTGPYEAGNNPNTFFGNFTSIWRKDANNNWKLLADLGTNYASSLYDTLVPKTFSHLIPATGKDTVALFIEQQFITLFEQQGIEAYKTVVNKATWLNMDKHHPAKTPENIYHQLTSLQQDIHFTPIAGGISGTHDLAYVYGTITSKQGKENYLRVWGHTNSGWIILCQVIKIVD